MPEPLTTPPGAEFAPVVRLPVGAVFDPGQRLDNHTCLMSADEHGAFMGRRLSCTDPDDQRAIWRRVALLYGASEDQAMHSRIEFTRIHDYTDGRRDVLVWRLSIPSRWFVEGEATTWGDLQGATAALCARVWGPR